MEIDDDQGIAQMVHLAPASLEIISITMLLVGLQILFRLDETVVYLITDPAESNFVIAAGNGVFAFHCVNL